MPSTSHDPLTDLASLVETLADWSAAPAELEGGRTDRSGWYAEGRPRVLVRATDRAEVGRTLAYADEHRIPVVTRGTGTGLSGGAAAGAGAIVLDLSGLNRIGSIDPLNRIAVVEAGVITADLDRAAGEHGLRYAPDPGSVEISTIGGNIATNAGGLRAAKYGVTRDAVLGLTVALADGSIVELGRQTIKGVTGYDLVSLLVGSEGTLGVVVEATLRLQPIPPATVTVAAYFAALEDAAAASAALAATPAQPAVIELVDGATLAAIDAVQGTSYRELGDAFLLVQTDGYGAAAEAAVVIESLSKTATRIEHSDDPETAASLLAARRLALPALERLGKVLIEDIAVPRDRLAEAIRGIREIADRTGVQIYTLGHVGDGNLHPIVVVPDGDIGEAEWSAAGEVFALALRLGGTLTGEHGVGTLKRRWIRDELGATVHDLHAELKRVFDPNGILNPGKAF